MVAARAKAAEPFEEELRAVNIALAALDGAPLIEVEHDAAPAPKAEPARKSGLGRGRIKRSLEDMILAALRAHDEGADTGSILESLERRWNRSFQESRVVDELRRLSAANTVVLERGHWRLKVQPDAWTGEAAAHHVAA
ncbi:hypothetical protein JKL49_03310 [Phenylobacterium sp. 20VBR1]|uniref:Uncharacterized protein n=1 Tax=Phenylobacterium glaciei TaxID=2803784 RepID=A0A941HUS5_9CAUL|nr:hypothetical protein [Phenylobacterium glaciei]MBR7618406.1 hypothetical protein [Phenylobacterium glaciei]